MIRLLTPDDWVLYKAIRLEAVEANPTVFWGTYEEESKFADEAWMDILKRIHIFGYFEQQQLAAVTGYFFPHTGSKTRHRIMISNVYVSPAHRGKSILKKLMDYIIAHVKEKGVEAVHLGVAVHNIVAIACYEKMGFTRYGTFPGSIKWDGNYIDEYLMVKYI